MPAPDYAALPDAHSLISQWAALWDAPQLPAFVRVRFSRRLGAAAGRCRPERGSIVLSETFVADHPEELARTLYHEAAHVVVWLQHGRRARPHGDARSDGWCGSAAPV